MSEPEQQHDPWRPPSGPPGPSGPGPSGPSGPPGPAGTATRRKVLPTGRPILLLGLAGLLLSLPMPPVGIALDIAAVVLGIRVLRNARRQDAEAPGAVAGVTMAGFALSVMVAVAVLIGVEWRAYGECMSGANTEIAKDNCLKQFQDSIERRFGIQIG